MNAPEFADKLDQEAEPALPDAMGYPSATEGSDRVENDPDKAHRRTVWLALVAAILVMALAGALYFGSRPSRSDLEASPEATTGFAPELALPQAPGLSSASRAFSPSSVLGPWPDSVAPSDGMMPSEPLSEIGARLAPEWSLALAIQADPKAYADTPSVRDGAVPRGAAPHIDASNPQADALARMPALPADAPTTGDLATSVAKIPESGVVSTEIVHPGITRRTYTSLATVLAQKVAECKQKGFIAGEACRMQVCSGHWGKVPACPKDEPAILP